MRKSFCRWNTFAQVCYLSSSQDSGDHLQTSEVLAPFKSQGFFTLTTAVTFGQNHFKPDEVLIWKHLKYTQFQTFLSISIQLRPIFVYCSVFPEQLLSMMNSCWSKNKSKLGWAFIKAIKVILLREKANGIYSVSPDKLIHRKISY